MRVILPHDRACPADGQCRMRTVLVPPPIRSFALLSASEPSAFLPGAVFLRCSVALVPDRILYAPFASTLPSRTTAPPPRRSEGASSSAGPLQVPPPAPQRTIAATSAPDTVTSAT